MVRKLVYVHKALFLNYNWVLQTKKLEMSRYQLKLVEKRNEMLGRKVKSGGLEKLKVIDNQRAINKRQSKFTSNEMELNRVAAELSKTSHSKSRRR